jgi:hypothetical protein
MNKFLSVAPHWYLLTTLSWNTKVSEALYLKHATMEQNYSYFPSLEKGQTNVLCAGGLTQFIVFH